MGDVARTFTPLLATAIFLGVVGTACGDMPVSENRAAVASTALPPAAADTLVVTGIFAPDGDELLQLGPLTLLEGDQGRLPDTARGIFVVEVTYADGTTTVVPFDALIADDSEQGNVLHGFFEVTAPLTGEVATVRIIGAGGERIFAEVAGADITP